MSVQKGRISVYIIIAVIIVAAVAAGVYYLLSNKKNKMPSKGTYVIECRGEVLRY